jgi:hypothetical protein
VKRPVKTRNIRAKPRTRIQEPANERDKKFCERWLVHHDHNKAMDEAGFAASNKNHAAGLQKLMKFRKYLERMQPKVELAVSKKLGYERADILEAIAAIANCNPLDYLKETTLINPTTQMAEQHMVLKPLHELSRAQASAVDSVFFDMTSGRIGYSLPKAKTRLSALTTLGEQAANFKKKDGQVHTHFHLGDDIPLEKIRAVKQMFIDLMGPRITREVLGFNEEEQAQ